MDILDQEASEDEGVRKNAARQGRRLDRLPSYEANIGLTNKEKRYRSMLDQASEADETIRSKWEQWEEAITRLTWDDVSLNLCSNSLRLALRFGKSTERSGQLGAVVNFDFRKQTKRSGQCADAGARASSSWSS